ncbi:retrotransposon protein, putative, ty1-copia subclass [Tanacetum coccineum]|uniref:Retrotransposon protein, putative, ty1-copia subclass n=1 Tax=Tanacetum coccineum TaxID=301880 RepID=A0ABQ4ZNS2_9ASTR
MLLNTEMLVLCLGVSTPELHRQFELYYPFDMISGLKSMFALQAGVRSFDLIQSFHACKQEEGKPVADYVLKMKGYVEKWKVLDVLPQYITFDNTVKSCYAYEYEKILPKGEKTTSNDDLRWIKFQKANKKSLNAKGNNKVKGKGKDKKVYIPKPKNPKPTAMERPAKDDVAHSATAFSNMVQQRRKQWVTIFYFPPGKQINVARYAELFEKRLISQEISGRAVDLEEIQEEEDTTLLKAIGHSSREVEEHSLGDLNEPTSYKAAMLDSESDKWIDAMNAEMQSMIDNMVWVLVDLPPNCKTVGSKWLFKIKTDMDGNVHTYKARLVAKGYTQLYGVDYEETFSPVADIRAIRILISIAAFYDYEIWQMDVKTAFLNGHLDEDIYMVQPEGFVDPKHPRKVCKLQRSIYGLKQASRSWNKRFDEEIKRFGFTQNLDEPCVYQKASGSNVTFLILYVDDIIIMGNHIPSLQSVKDYLGKCFAMKDLGEAAFILGIKIYRDRSKRLIGLSQSAYMDKILKRYRMDNSKRGHIPMQERLDLNKTQGASTPEEVKRMQNAPYASAVGSIMYALRCTRLDVAFAQNITSRFQQNPGEPHWTAVKTILKYLRNTKDMFLVYGGNPDAELRVECYCDAGFETDRDDTKSQTGYVFILNGGAVDWKSSKQSTTAMSATEAEYIAASEAAMEAVWIRKFISGLGIVPTINEPIKMFCDNSAALHFANEPGVQRGARHYHRRYHYVHESVALGEIKFLKVHTDDNLADPFTKALPNGKLTQHARSMGLRLASSFM